MSVTFERPDQGLLADTLFDFRDSPTGWRYRWLDESGAGYELAPLPTARDDMATAGAVIVAPNPSCYFGRDLVHPAIGATPAIAWTAPHDGVFDLTGSCCPLRPWMASRARLSIRIGDLPPIETVYGFPECLKYAVRFEAQGGHKVWLHFRAEGGVENLDSHILAQIRAVAAPAAVPETRIVNASLVVGMSDAWKARISAVKAASGVDHELAVTLASDPFRVSDRASFPVGRIVEESVQVLPDFGPGVAFRFSGGKTGADG